MSLAPVRAGITAALVAVFLFPSFSYAAPVACECVRYLREIRGIPIRGNAWAIEPTHSLEMAVEGDVLLTREGPGHAAEIVGFEGIVAEDNYTRPEYIWLIEANYSRCRVGTRKIRWDDPEIRGIYRPLSTVASF